MASNTKVYGRMVPRDNSHGCCGPAHEPTTDNIGTAIDLHIGGQYQGWSFCSSQCLADWAYDDAMRNLTEADS